MKVEIGVEVGVVVEVKVQEGEEKKKKREREKEKNEHKKSDQYPSRVSREKYGVHKPDNPVIRVFLLVWIFS